MSQAYPDGLSDERLQVLGSSSRSATPSDVTRWNVTKIDTLSSLMASGNGEWDPEMVMNVSLRCCDVQSDVNCVTCTCEVAC